MLNIASIGCLRQCSSFLGCAVFVDIASAGKPVEAFNFVEPCDCIGSAESLSIGGIRKIRFADKRQVKLWNQVFHIDLLSGGTICDCTW